MPGTVTPAQMFDHELNPVKGWPSPYALDKTKELASGETIERGRAMHIDPATDQFKLGCPNDYMPIFAFPSSADFDVSSDVGNISGNVMMGLVALGAYELETTEYMGAGFTPNVPLTVHNVADANQGKIKVTTIAAADLIVGVVSDAGPLTNEFAKTMVRFWPTWLPNRAAQ